MKRFLEKATVVIENAPLTLGSFSLTFLALIIARLTVENTLGYFQEQTLFFFFFEFTHTFLFFLCSFILLLPAVRLAGESSLKKAANVLLFGFLIILTPPIIDRLIMGAGNYWSFYQFDSLKGLFLRFFTLFGDSPDIGITYGVRVEVVLVTILLGCYAYLKTARLKTAFLTSLLTYTILFILGTFPAWLTFGILGLQKGLLAIGSNDVAALFLTPETILARHLDDFHAVLNFKMTLVYGVLASLLAGLLLFKEFPHYFFALLKNARLPQVIYHGGLLLLGILLALFFSHTTLPREFFPMLSIIVLLLSVEYAWLASVIVNDLYDTAIDAITNPSRPLITAAISPRLYRTFGVLFFSASLLLSGSVSFAALFLLLAYQALAWLYSAPPLRLKRFPIIATLIAACSGLAVLISGFLAVSSQTGIHQLPVPLLVFLFIAYTLTLPIKDFKDIAGDQKDGVFTLPVLLGETLAKQVTGSALFLLAMISPIVLNARNLFLPALLYGGFAFFGIQKGNGNEQSFFAYRKLPLLILSLTIFYGVVIVIFLF